MKQTLAMNSCQLALSLAELFGTVTASGIIGAGRPDIGLGAGGREECWLSIPGGREEGIFIWFKF